MHHRDRQGRGDFDHKVAIGHGVEAVRRDSREIQQARRVPAVNRIVGAGQRPGPERHHVQPHQGIADPALVPLEHLHIGQQMMRQQHRLGPLQVRVARHRHGTIRLRLGDQDTFELLDPSNELIQLVTEIQPDIQRDLVVPAAACMQLSAQRADQFRQSSLDRHVNVFIAGRKAESPAIEFCLHRFKPAHDNPRFTRSQHTCLAQRLAMGNTTLNVMCVEPTVDRHRHGERFDQTVRLFPKSSLPGLARNGTSPVASFPCRHQDEAFFRCALIFSRNAFRRMNPSASFWL